jgi:hypothetical protein
MYEFIHVWDEKHAVFSGVRTAIEEIKPPANYDYREFKGRWKGPAIPVLRVHKTTPGKGWVPWGYGIYDDGGLGDSPDSELICGGVTSKGPAYYSILRHGRFLLWGFSPLPDDFTEQGAKLFLNCLRYISRFAEDAPIVRKTTDSRKRIIHTIEHSKLDKRMMWILERDLPAEVIESTKKDLDALENWYRENEPYLHRASGARQGKTAVDEAAREFKTPNGQVESLGRWVELLGSEHRDSAHGLLKRYTAQAFEADPAAWQAWLKENRDYLFFSDSGGFRFFIDERAKKAGIPTARFRAPR